MLHSGRTSSYSLIECFSNTVLDKTFQVGSVDGGHDVILNGVVQFFYLPLIHSVLASTPTTTWYEIG